MKYGALRFLHDSVQQEVPIDEVSLTIGRAPGVGIQIDDPSVSRRHARLTYEGARLWIEDLGSTNGVFVGGVRIAPNSRVVVAPGQHLRIGNIEAEVIPPSSVSPGNGNSQPVTPPVSAGLRIEVFPPHLSVDPGSTSSIEVRVSNRGSVVDEAELAVAGVPAEWLTVAERSVRLLPGEERSTTLQVSPPRSTAADARDYTLTITANSLSGRSGPQQATAIVEVRPFADARLELRPVRGAGPFSVIATNRGNAPIAYALDGMDDEGVLTFDFSEPELHADADTEGTVRARIKHSSPGRFGKEKLAPFTIVARRIGGDGGEEKLQGQLVVTPPLEKYRKPVIVLLILAAIGLLAFGLWFVSRDWDWGHLPPWADEAASPPSQTVTDQTPGAETPNPATETVEAATEQAGGGAGGDTPEAPTDTPTPTDTPEPEIVIPTDGLVAEYLFNRNVDDSLSDDSGQPFGTPRLTTDRFGNANNALLLDGVDDQVVFGRDEFTDSNDISVSVWINVDSLDENLKFFLVSSDAALFTRGDRAGIAISVPSTDSASGTIRAGEWHHLLGTYDGNQIKFYVDGQLAQTTDHPGDISDPNRRLTLGTFAGNFWAGAIDDLRIYDRVIEDQDEIDALFGEGGFKKTTRRPELPTVPTRVISPISPVRPTVSIGQIASD